MKIQSEKREVSSSGFTEDSKAFTINNSAKMFHILSNSLYSDKPMAVIRELSCNAFDAHIAAGTQDKPFIVHLPNSFEPYFSIRDFGTGLSHEDMVGLYTTYGGSSKTESDEYIGQLGLGSKSPFSYVDQFTVTSYFNGKQSVYLAMMDEDGIPTIQPVSLDNDTTEPNGLEIYMAAKVADFNAFADRARRFFHRFPVIPEIKGNKNAKLTNVEYGLTGENFKVRNNDNWEHASGAHAIQGVVAYPINEENFSIPLTRQQKAILEANVDIEFPIGELEVAPSREALSYNRRTQENILKALQKIEATVPALVDDILKDAKNYYEACKLYSKWLEGNGSNFVRLLVGNTLTWQGQEIKSSSVRISLRDETIVDRRKIANYKLQNNDPTAVKADADLPDIQWGSVNTIDRWTIDRNLKKPLTDYEKIYHNVDLARLMGKTEFTAKTKGSHTNGYTYAVWIDDQSYIRNLAKLLCHNFKNLNVNVLAFRAEPGFEATIKDQFGGFDDWILASELEPIPVEEKTPRKAEVRKMHRVTGSSSYSVHIDENSVDADMTEGGTYLVQYRGQPSIEKDQWVAAGTVPQANDDLAADLYCLYKFGFLDYKAETIYAFNSTHKTILNKYSGWKSIYDLIREKLTAQSKDADFMEGFLKTLEYQQLLDDRDIVKMFAFMKSQEENILTKIDSKSPYYQFVNGYLVPLAQAAFEFGEKYPEFKGKTRDWDYTNERIKLNEVAKFADIMTRIFDDKKFNKLLEKQKETVESKRVKFFAAYPLFSLIMEKQTTNINHYLPLYIQQCDKTTTLIKNYK